MTLLPHAVTLHRSLPLGRVATITSALAALATTAALYASKADARIPPQVVAHISAPGQPLRFGRIDHRRASHSPVPLPVSGKVSWRTTVAGIEGPIATDGLGNTLLTTSSSMYVELDARGRVTSRRSLPGTSASGVAILAQGDRVLVTHNGYYQRFNAQGAPYAPVPLNRSVPPRGATLLAMRDGSVVVGAGSNAWWLHTDGEVRAQIAVPEFITQLFETDKGIALLTDEGTIHGWDGVTEPTVLHQLPRRALVEWDVPEQRWLYTSDTTLLALDGNGGLAPWLELPVGNFTTNPTRVGERYVARASGDLLLYVGPEGELARASIGGGAERASASLGLLADSSGVVALIARDGGLVLVAADLSESRPEGARCTTPSGLVPVGPARLVLGCAEGTLFGIGE